MSSRITVWIAKVLKDNKLLYRMAAGSFFLLYRVYCLFKYHYADFFWTVAIEISTKCNRRCYYCPNSKYGTPDEHMPDELFEKIITNLNALRYTGGVTFQFYGEPLLDERLVRFVRYTRQNVPGAMFIKVVSNGDMLTMELLERLIEAGMREISITIHDLDPAKMMERLKPMIDRHPRHIRVTSIHNSASLNNRGGAIEIENEVPMKKCTGTGILVIDHNGDELLCCSDYFHAHVMGNVNEERIEGIWKKKEFERYRGAARKGRPALEICEKCLGVS
jgi:radical SAM protein with 4Fe4S-binding SPASM domain